MSIYHCSIKIISRSSGRSAVASAAYRAGEKLLNDETGMLHDFTRKSGVVMSEILLPEHVPSAFRNRQVLWNEVQKTERRSDAQLAREVEVAFPVEMTRPQQIECIRNYIQENFVSEGMIADWSLHDKDDGNPHAHIMLTVRGFDEHEQWQAKTKTVFANTRDAKGRAVFDPSLPSYDPKDREHTSQYRIPQLDGNGEQKSRIRKGKGTEYLWEKVTIPANDWNDRQNAEKWRASWAQHCNLYLEKEQQIDHRSYARQGLDQEPTIHEGVTARNMELTGMTADRCQINREVRERNLIREKIRKLTAELTAAILKKARELYAVKPVHDFKEHKRLKICFPESPDPVPKSNDHYQSCKHGEKEQDHEPFSLPRNSLQVRQTDLISPFLYRLRIEIKTIQRIIPYTKLHHQRKENAEQGKLQNYHFLCSINTTSVLFPSDKECRSRQHQPLSLSFGHEQSVIRRDKMHLFVPLFPEYIHKRLHIPVPSLRHDVVDGKCAALFQNPKRFKQRFLLADSRDIVIDIVAGDSIKSPVLKIQVYGIALHKACIVHTLRS